MWELTWTWDHMICLWRFVMFSRKQQLDVKNLNVPNLHRQQWQQPNALLANRKKGNCNHNWGANYEYNYTLDNNTILETAQHSGTIYNSSPQNFSCAVPLLHPYTVSTETLLRLRPFYKHFYWVAWHYVWGCCGLGSLTPQAQWLPSFLGHPWTTFA